MRFSQPERRPLILIILSLPIYLIRQEISAVGSLFFFYLRFLTTLSSPFVFSDVFEKNTVFYAIFCIPRFFLASLIVSGIIGPFLGLSFLITLHFLPEDSSFYLKAFSVVFLFLHFAHCIIRKYNKNENPIVKEQIKALFPLILYGVQDILSIFLTLFILVTVVHFPKLFLLKFQPYKKIYFRFTLHLSLRSFEDVIMQGVPRLILQVLRWRLAETEEILREVKPKILYRSAVLYSQALQAIIDVLAIPLVVLLFLPPFICLHEFSQSFSIDRLHQMRSLLIQCAFRSLFDLLAFLTAVFFHVLAPQKIPIHLTIMKQAIKLKRSKTVFIQVSLLLSLIAFLEFINLFMVFSMTLCFWRWKVFKERIRTIKGLESIDDRTGFVGMTSKMSKTVAETVFFGHLVDLHMAALGNGFLGFIDLFIFIIGVPPLVLSPLRIGAIIPKIRESSLETREKIRIIKGFLLKNYKGALTDYLSLAILILMVLNPRKWSISFGKDNTLMRNDYSKLDICWLDDWFALSLEMLSFSVRDVFFYNFIRVILLVFPKNNASYNLEIATIDIADFSLQNQSLWNHFVISINRLRVNSEKIFCKKIYKDLFDRLEIPEQKNPGGVLESFSIKYKENERLKLLRVIQYHKYMSYLVILLCLPGVLCFFKAYRNKLAKFDNELRDSATVSRGFVRSVLSKKRSYAIHLAVVFWTYVIVGILSFIQGIFIAWRWPLVFFLVKRPAIVKEFLLQKYKVSQKASENFSKPPAYRIAVAINIAFLQTISETVSLGPSLLLSLLSPYRVYFLVKEQFSLKWFRVYDNQDGTKGDESYENVLCVFRRTKSTFHRSGREALSDFLTTVLVILILVTLIRVVFLTKMLKKNLGSGRSNTISFKKCVRLSFYEMLKDIPFVFISLLTLILGFWRLPHVLAFYLNTFQRIPSNESNTKVVSYRIYIVKVFLQVLVNDYPVLLCLLIASLTLYKIPKVLKFIGAIAFNEMRILKLKTKKENSSWKELKQFDTLKRAWSLAMETIMEIEMVVYSVILAVTFYRLKRTLKRVKRIREYKRKQSYEQAQGEKAIERFGNTQHLFTEAIREQEFSMIVEFLEPKDIYMLGRTCKMFHQYSKADYIWEEVEKNFIRPNKELSAINVPHEDKSPYQKAIDLFNISYLSKNKGITEEEKDILFGYKYCIIEEYTLLLTEASSLILTGEELFGKLLIKTIPLRFFTTLPLFNQQWHSSKLDRDSNYSFLNMRNGFLSTVNQGIIQEKRFGVDLFPQFAPFILIGKFGFIVVNFIHELSFIWFYIGHKYLIIPKRRFPDNEVFQAIAFDFRFSFGHSGFFFLMLFLMIGIPILPFWACFHFGWTFFPTKIALMIPGIYLAWAAILLIPMDESRNLRDVPMVFIEGLAILLLVFRIMKRLLGYILHKVRILFRMVFRMAKAATKAILLPVFLAIKRVCRAITLSIRGIWTALSYIVRGIYSLNGEILVLATLALKPFGLLGDILLLPVSFLWMFWPFMLSYWYKGFFESIPFLFVSLYLCFKGYVLIERATRGR